MFIICTSVTIASSEERTSLKMCMKLLNIKDGDYVFMGVRECIERDGA